MMRTCRTQKEFNEALRRIANTFACRAEDWHKEDSDLHNSVMINITFLEKFSRFIQFEKKKIWDLNIEQDGNVFYYGGWKQSKRRASR